MEQKLCSCGKLAAKYRTICYTCKSKNFRERNPILYIWFNLKKSATKRGYVFDLPIEWFKPFVEESGLLENRGRNAESLSVDRIENDKGYVVGNVRVLSKSENSTRYWEEFRQLRDLPNCAYELDENYEHPF